MDPNQNQNTPNQTTPPVQNPMDSTAGTVPPAAPSAPPNVPSTEDPKSNRKVILFIVVGILLLIILGAIYFMATQLNNQYKTPTPTQALPTSTPTPTPLSEKDINTIDLGDPDTDLKSIDEDVKQL